MMFNVEIGRQRDGVGWFAVVKTTTGGEPYRAPIGSTGRIEQESLVSLLGCVAKFALGFFKQAESIESYVERETLDPDAFKAAMSEDGIWIRKTP